MKIPINLPPDPLDNGKLGLRLDLPYPVSANRYWRHQAGKTHVSSEAKAFREEAGWRARSVGIHKPLTGRLRIDIELFPKQPKDWEARQAKDPEGWDDSVLCMDLDNAIKVTIDALQHIVYANDSQLWRINVRRMAPWPGGRMVVMVRQI